jgi:uncharacterized protein (UPF0261 family)
LDTKGEQLDLLRNRIASRGHRALLMDLSLGGASRFAADVTPEDLVRLAGGDIEAFHASRERAPKSEVVIRGAHEKMAELLSEGNLDGVVAMGGASMAIMGSRILSRLPFGVPKAIATPAAMPAYLSEWFGAMDVVVMQLIMEFTGMNDLLRQAIGQVAGVISGMAEESRPVSALRLPYPAVAVTEIGFSPKCSHRVGELLEAKGYHVYPFHAQGISERAMDRLIDQGFFQGVIDIVPAGLIEELFQGNRAAGMERLDAACRTGIPQVLAPCTLNLTGCGPTRKNGAEYASRERVWKMDALRAMTRYNADELRQGAEAYAQKLNAATGPTKFLFPRRGWSAIDGPGSCLHDPEQDRVFVETLRAHLKPEVELVELDCNLEDPEFAEALVESFHEAFGKRTTHTASSVPERQECAA